MTNTAIVFPGQGSQSVAMLGDIAMQYVEIEQTFSEASVVLGYDLWELTQVGPQETLDQTIHTQPALLAAGVAMYRILQANKNLSPSYFAGHSLGEYTALVCANVLSFSDAIKIVAARGQYMQEAVPAGVGAMAAIVGLDNSIVTDMCLQVSSPDRMVAPANFNSIGQVVIAGHLSAVEAVMQLAKEHGAKLAVLLPVSVPSHCALMQPAAHRLALLLESITISEPTIPVINNIDVAVYQSSADIRTGLVRQLFHPVRWVEIIEFMQRQGVDTIIECGPGKVLSGLIKRIDKNIDLLTTSDLASLERVV